MGPHECLYEDLSNNYQCSRVSIASEIFIIIMAATPSVWWSYWFHKNSIVVEDPYQDFNVWTVLIKRPNGLTSNFLIMLILLKSRSERKEFCWLQRFRWFWSAYSTNFYGFEIAVKPRFYKIGGLSPVCCHMYSERHPSIVEMSFGWCWCHVLILSYTPPCFWASNSRITILCTLLQSDVLKCIFFCLVRITKYRNKN
jgi:hypothetical protein